MSHHIPFYNEIFQFSETDAKVISKDTQNHKNNAFKILSTTPKEDWSDTVTKMIDKVILLCGFSPEDTSFISFSSSVDISRTLQKKQVKYVLCFLNEGLLKKLHFRRSKQGFTTVGQKKIIFLPPVNVFERHQQSKQFLWKAIQQEFPQTINNQ